SLGRLMQILAFASLVSMALYIPANSYVYLFAITFIFSLTYPNILPAMESGATVLMQTDRIHYGKGRSFGSVGYMVAVLIVGIATSIWLEAAILSVMIAGLLFMAITLSTVSPAPLSVKPEPKNKASKGAVKELLRSKAFLT